MGKPQIDNFDHPVFHPRQFPLDTPATNKLHEDVRRWLWTGATGAFVPGPARAGKTYAVNNISDQLYTRYKVKIPVYYVLIPRRDQKTITSVFRQLCGQNTLRVSSRDIADQLSDRFVHYLDEQAIKTNCQDAVLFVDETQRLKPHQLDAFAEVHDKLERLDVFLSVFFIGNEVECGSLLKVIVTAKYEHIRGRFFTQTSRFQGLTSAKEVKFCLEQYDTLRFPSDGPSYTGFFLPEFVSHGGQLASLNESIWRVFREYQKSYHIPSWGMKYFRLAITSLLTDMLPQYGLEEFDDEMVRHCIDLSGLVASTVKTESDE